MNTKGKKRYCLVFLELNLKSEGKRNKGWRGSHPLQLVLCGGLFTLTPNPLLLNDRLAIAWRRFSAYPNH